MTDSAKILSIRAAMVFCAFSLFVTGFLVGSSCEVRNQIKESRRVALPPAATPTFRESSPETVRAFRVAEFKRAADEATLALEQLTKALDGFMATMQSVVKNQEAWRQLALMRVLLAPGHPPCTKPDLRDCYKDKQP